MLMKVIDEIHQILWGAVPARGGKVAGRLVSPRAIERMLGQRQKLDVSEARLRDILREPRGNLTVTQRPVLLFGNAPPRSEMDLINRNCRMDGISICARLHPVLVIPFVI